MLASVALACSGGAQVAAGLVGGLPWQVGFLLVTVFCAAIGTWLTIAQVPPRLIGVSSLRHLKKLVDYSKWGQDSVARLR
ncbi:hypothetical protein [Amycolatopsis sp. SID8362]|uniref:hypothetical protein n=1 Tax=Amycolatopsis sp. SID8362 TaxID=2690346 RepID=UPI00136E7B9A|nr:hypothetical protein [Amycolatopsis sp. SID8362]NBH02783.1 hypothetical protein [Amycolatopsis sp. SID8362]NBH09668.1 hypothetical protein [Amycolatopsis sp. SID8362]NED39485.1 hypothetical protein [Amycolatopsis sp. SID8362]NED46360.1 hypothetical protein [Amycolatopsis sp. SID8362]